MAANTDFFDANIRRGVDIERLKKGESAAAIALLDRGLPDLESRVRKSLNSLKSGRANRGSRRLAALVGSLQKSRAEAFRAVNASHRSIMTEFAQDEVAFQKMAADVSFPVVLDLVSPTAARLRSAVFTVPFQGLKWHDHITRLKAQDAVRVRSAVNLGFVQGETTEQIIGRLFGTDAAGRRDGALAISRFHLDAIVKTSLNHVANQAREEMWAGNSDIIRVLRWTSTLDGRTSAICRRRDGKVVLVPGKKLKPGEKLLVPQGARPPALYRCRSVMIAILDGIAMIGTRPTVTDTRNRRAREVNFREDARNAAGRRWDNWGQRERRAAVGLQRKKWVDQNIGEAPAATTYDGWLRTQKPSFQNDVLGQAKGKLFRDGDLTLDAFVDHKGKEYTLAELRDRVPQAFADAGL